MIQQLQDRVFSSLKISKDQILNEMAIILVKQQLSEYSMEVDYFEKKYGESFEKFDRKFSKQKSTYEIENDWLSWKFAVESKQYWLNILSDKNYDS